MKRHPIDPFSVVVGIVLLIGAGLWLAWDQASLGGTEVLITIPIVLIVGGIAGIVASAIAHHRRENS